MCIYVEFVTLKLIEESHDSFPEGGLTVIGVLFIKDIYFLNTCFKLPAMHGDVSDVGVRRITNCKNSPFGNVPLSITHPNHNIKEKLKIKNYDRKHDILNFTLSAS